MIWRLFPEALKAGPERTSEHKFPAFVNSDFTGASGKDDACHCRDKTAEPAGGGFQAKAALDKQDKVQSSCIDSAGKCGYSADRNCSFSEAPLYMEIDFFKS